MEDALDGFPDTTQPAIQATSILKVLIGTARGPDQIVGLVEDLGLPFQTDETFISEKAATGNLIYGGFRWTKHRWQIYRLIIAKKSQRITIF